MIVRNALIWVLVIGLFASLLIGWAVAYWYDRRRKEEEDVIRKVREDSDIP